MRFGGSAAGVAPPPKRRDKPTAAATKRARPTLRPYADIVTEKALGGGMFTLKLPWAKVRCLFLSLLEWFVHPWVRY